MKKMSLIKKVLPIIFLLLLLFLIPLFKSNYTNEYYCNYEIDDVVVKEKYNCEGEFFNQYKTVSGDDNGVITANGGTATECIDIISSLLDKLGYFFIVKSQISDTSACELAVAQAQIESLVNLIKLKLLSIDSCQITYEQDDILQAKLTSLSNSVNVDSNVIADIRYYALRHSVKDGEESRLQQKIDRADLCLGYNREDVFQNNITDCSVKGDSILGLPDYSTTPIEYTLNVADILI